MAEGLNQCDFIGNLGADPELKMTQGGQAILKFRIACTVSYLDKDNARKERTEWIPCTLWGKRGEALSRILVSGSKVYVQGAFQTSSYEKDGEKRYRTEINVRNVLLLGSKGDASDDRGSRSRASGNGSRGRRDARRDVEPADDFGGGDDDIPF